MPLVRSATATRDGVVVNPPTDPKLASLWELAELETEASSGKTAETTAEWNAVTARYHELLTERRAELSGLVREVVSRRSRTPIAWSHQPNGGPS
jgi:hypothetical protein